MVEVWRIVRVSVRWDPIGRTLSGGEVIFFHSDVHKIDVISNVWCETTVGNYTTRKMYLNLKYNGALFTSNL